MEGEGETTRPFPTSIERGLLELLHDDADDDNHQDQLMHLVWSELTLQELDLAFELPAHPSSFSTITNFVQTELKIQIEMIRNDLCLKFHRQHSKPKPEDKHLRFPLPLVVRNQRTLNIDFSQVHKVPSRGQFTNYVVLLQRLVGSGETERMENLTLGYCEQLQKKNGASFHLGADAEALSNLSAGEQIYVRVLKNFNMLKTHFRALTALHRAQEQLNESFVIKQLLEGHINSNDMQTQDRLDQWIESKMQTQSSSSSAATSTDLQSFNQQQQRALALEALTETGVVLIQGPPGTGKSHIICHGILPQIVARNEKVLVLCNSNVAVDALMLKCTSISSLKNSMLRCGFKVNVSDVIINKGLYAEGDLQSQMDSYGKQPGSNSNTDDSVVQQQIRSTSVIFTTIHYASKEKGKSAAEPYWQFDTVILDEAAQIEDSKLFIVLARCPSLKKMILVGDPKQLQPYVPDSIRNQGFGKSTMERLMENSTKNLSPQSASRNCATPFIMLEVQFRMAPSLRQIVSHLYYDDKLQDGDEVLQRGPVDAVKLQPLLVVDLTGSKMNFNPLHQSYENVGEAMIVKVVCDFLLSSDFDGTLPKEVGKLTPKDICILTPFNRHKDRLRMLLCGIEEEELDKYSGQTFGNNDLGSPVKKSQALYGTQEDVPEDWAAMAENIDTVDKFQGSERKVVIISTCVDRKPLRAADPHFINVACSRAQHLLVVVGNFSQGLSINRDWRYVWNEAKKSGSFIEHAVTNNSIVEDSTNDGDPLPDIHEESFNTKLLDFLGRPSQRRR